MKGISRAKVNLTLNVPLKLTFGQERVRTKALKCPLRITSGIGKVRIAFFPHSRGKGLELPEPSTSKATKHASFRHV